MTRLSSFQSYVPGLTIQDYLELVRTRFPDLSDLLWFGRDYASDAFSELMSLNNEFETDATGRGGSYRRAQRNHIVRAQGIMSLFMLAAGDRGMTSIPAGWRLLDILGGNGLLARNFQEMVPQAANAVITSDMAGQMVVEALNDGLPAIRQRAQFLFMRDDSVDAALIAYGTH